MGADMGAGCKKCYPLTCAMLYLPAFYQPPFFPLVKSPTWPILYVAGQIIRPYKGMENKLEEKIKAMQHPQP